MRAFPRPLPFLEATSPLSMVQRNVRSLQDRAHRRHMAHSPPLGFSSAGFWAELSKPAGEVGSLNNWKLTVYLLLPGPHWV